jgi:glycosyltransferase involved in cell wall biosynthesis
MKIVALPRDPNPYQRLLYSELEKLGFRVRYAGALTPSHSLNVLLLPLELAAGRLAGWRVLHLHWVYGFNFFGAERFAPLRRVSQAWFQFVLRSARALGMRVVWTAHNVLPHRRVFHDDVLARRELVRLSDLVLVHSSAVEQELVALGAPPRRATVVPHGPFLPVKGTRLSPPGDGSPRELLFFGRVEEYKGVEDLLEAMRALPRRADARLTVAGPCRDRDLAARLATLADGRVTLRLEHLPDDELTGLLSSADVVVLPFRRVTTSGSAVLAMAHGRPVLVPALDAFANLPDDAVIRYHGPLGDALLRAAEMPAERLRSIGVAAARHAASAGWPEAARRTSVALAEAVS